MKNFRTNSYIMRKLFTIAFIALIIQGCTPKSDSITILHTNDIHSHMEADEEENRGGVAGIEKIVAHIRDSVGAENTLLLDCGDFSQGSLLYNIHKGKFETDAMNILCYDAAAIGNHELDYGMENLARIIKNAKFPFLCANYDFTNTPCEHIVEPYKILEKSGRRIGLFGLSPDPSGIVLKENYTGLTFKSPTEAAQKCADALQAAGCNIVICLSHLGWRTAGQYNDSIIATQTNGIDIIIGGHSHDHFEKPITYKNNKGDNVIVNQAGKYGQHIGMITVKFAK